MHNNHSLKRLLAVTAVAAMFSAFGVHAQTTGAGSTGTPAAGQDTTNMTGKTTSEGTVGNTQSRGTEEKAGASQGSTQGSTGSQGLSGVGDTSGATSQTGKTTSEGTIGNTNSMGMEKHEGKEQSGTSGTSGSSSQGTSGGTASTGAAAAGATAAGTAGSSKLSKGDEKILKDVAQANIDEIEAAKLAQTKSQNDQVKSFAQQMIDDHGKALTDTQQLAQQKGVTLPTEPDAKHKAMATKLQAMSGAAFDKAYMAQAGVSDHKAVHSALLRDEKKAKDPDVKALVAKITPVVEQHLKSAEQMKVTTSGTTSGK
jgi:predicted outer membrane protein